MTPDGLHELAQAVRAVAHGRCVLTGEGGAFCLGADLKWLGSLADPDAGVAELVAQHHEAVLAMHRCPAPVVAAVNGAAAGGGWSLALAADYVVAAPSATFTAAYFRLGLTPDGGNSAFLGPRAMELLLTNRTLSAEEARAMGLVNEITEDPLVRANELRLEDVPGETLRETRRLLRPDLEQRLKNEAAAVAAAARRSEFKKALDAFLKRI
jgi:2-(1,2-epoxy-1,2-dihydrophenyl)acetyl-CoA isomerase